MDDKLLGDMNDFVPTALFTSAISDKGNGLFWKHGSGIKLVRARKDGGRQSVGC